MIIEVNHQASIAQLFSRANGVEVRRQALGTPAEGSPFADDLRDWSRLYSVMGLRTNVDLAQRTALSASTHLFAARQKEWDPFTPFTLLRGTLEACGLALWLIQPQESDARLQRWRGLEAHSEEYRKNAVESSWGRSHEKIVQYTHIAATRSETADQISSDRINTPGSKELLRKAGNSLDSSKTFWEPLTAWQVTSSFAHSMPWSIDEATHVTTSGTIKFDEALFHYVLETCVELFDALVTRIEHLSSPPPSDNHTSP